MMHLHLIVIELPLGGLEGGAGVGLQGPGEGRRRQRGFSRDRLQVKHDLLLVCGALEHASDFVE